MNKIKMVKQSGVTRLMIKSIKGQQLSEHEVYSINNNEVQGLLHLDVMQKNNSFKLYYNVTGFISFRQFLKTPLTKSSFAALLKNILECLLAVKKAYFHQENMLMDFNHVMVNPSTQKIYFVYVPIQGFDSGYSLRDFLLDIIQFCTFAPNEDASYVREYITILNNGINFSVFELEEYVKKLFGIGTPVQFVIECPNCHTQLRGGISYCTSCGGKLTGNTGGIGKKGAYNPFEEAPNPVENKAGLVETFSPKDSTQGLSTGTTVLGEDIGGTTVLSPEEILPIEEISMPNYPYLIREKNDEKILINKPSFRIGKEKKYCDYFVSDNNAVSRSHADIITRDKRYFIIDLNSTNKTYVDGRAIAVEKETEIFDQTKLRLANEDFVFYIEE